MSGEFASPRKTVGHKSVTGERGPHAFTPQRGRELQSPTRQVAAPRQVDDCGFTMGMKASAPIFWVTT